MNIQGQLSIALAPNNTGVNTTITSSRPLHAAQIFSGKSVSETLKLMPILFNVCGKAQAVTCVNAIESAICSPADQAVQSQREALVLIESLREHSLRILIDWPKFIDSDVEQRQLALTVQSLNTLMQMLEPEKLLSLEAKASSISTEIVRQWQQCQQLLSQVIFATPIDDWQTFNEQEVENWSQKSHSKPAAFIAWLLQQQWKYAGSSDITPLPDINQLDFLNQLQTQSYEFISQPDWDYHCYELSWFNYQYDSPLISDLITKRSNGIYTRMVARLCEVADLIQQLNAFFQLKSPLKMQISTIEGLAHTHAARGRLSHYVQLERHTIEQLWIIAPTEWNFHPQGVAAQSLCHLSIDDESTLRSQAELIIHAIDPCVDYQLHINNRTHH